MRWVNVPEWSWLTACVPAGCCWPGLGWWGRSSGGSESCRGTALLFRVHSVVPWPACSPEPSWTSWGKRLVRPGDSKQDQCRKEQLRLEQCQSFTDTCYGQYINFISLHLEEYNLKPVLNPAQVCFRTPYAIKNNQIRVRSPHNARNEVVEGIKKEEKKKK